MPSTNSAMVLVTDALRLAGVIASGQTPSAAEGEDSRRVLNAMVDAWRNDRLALYLTEIITTPLVASQPSYTVGAAGEIVVARPLSVADAGLVDTLQDPDFEWPIEVLTVQRWRGIEQKLLTDAWVQAIYYEPTIPTGTLHVWPVPTGSTLSLRLYLPKTLGTFADMTTEYQFPDGYEEALKYNLTLRLIEEFEREPKPRVEKLAREALARIKRTNNPNTELVLDPAMPGMRRYSNYDIRRDS